MSRTLTLLIALMVAVGLTALYLCHPTSAAEPRNWLQAMDILAKEFSAELIVEGKAYPLEGPRRMAFYEPKRTELSRVVHGACYAMHLDGNPEIIIAIETAAEGEETFTYIEVSRLSGAAMNVYRKGERVARFPRAERIEGAYVGMAL